MIQTINPYATARTAEIMSRYRPIAPKPEAPPAAAENDNSALPSGIRKSPYLSNVWAHLQARPTRTRKRGRTAAFAPPPIKRTRLPQPPKNLAMHGFNGTPQISLLPNFASLDAAVTTLAESVALPLLRRPVVVVRNGIDLNRAAEQQPVELDLLPAEPVQPVVISPRPVRPVGSSITVKDITTVEAGASTAAKAAEEVEEAVEAEIDPAIVSDSNNKVRISNSAYKEMVGQPECCWLDCAGACKRIGGEVLLQFAGPAPMAAAAFTCLVKIEWEREGEKRSVNALCSGVKLVCEGKDYQFLWRFRTAGEGGSKSN